MSRRRTRRGRRRRTTDEKGPIDRIWSRATEPRVAGVCLLMAGVLLAVTPWTGAPEPLVVSWWDTSLHVPGVASVAAGLAALAAVLMVGSLWNRYRLVTGSVAEKTAPADATLELGAETTSVKESRLPGIAWTGAVCLAVGVVLVLGGWFASHSEISASRVLLTSGETIEHYSVEQGPRDLDVMLPLRLRLDRLETDGTPTAHLQAFELGEDRPDPQAIPPGGGLELDGFRVTFVGMRSDSEKLAAVFGSDDPDTIRASATEGETFEVGLDGPTFEVLEITRDYLGAMGPAARVRSEDVGEFWVFQSAANTQLPPDLGHSLRLEALETQPAAVFTVAKSQPFWPLSVGGTLFVLGFALLIAVPERIVRLTERTVRLWSINDAGRITEQTLGELADTEARGAQS
ncbi:MAG: hypothetical protein ACLFVJ_05480 [Persicimonas sp.]